MFWMHFQPLILAALTRLVAVCFGGLVPMTMIERIERESQLLRQDFE